jgi:hypothetical protein
MLYVHNTATTLRTQSWNVICASHTYCPQSRDPRCYAIVLGVNVWAIGDRLFVAPLEVGARGKCPARPTQRPALNAHALLSICYIFWNAHNKFTYEWTPTRINILCTRYNAPWSFRGETSSGRAALNAATTLTCFLQYLVIYGSAAWTSWVSYTFANNHKPCHVTKYFMHKNNFMRWKCGPKPPPR